MKKNIITFYLKFTSSIALLLMLSYSCDNLVDEKPISVLGEDNFWLNNDDATAGVIAAYQIMQQAYNSEHYQWGEFRADNFIGFGGTTNLNNLELINNGLQPGNAIYRWNQLYTMINRANLAIANIPNITGADPNLLSEALAIRAKGYFDAVRIWGAVPLFTEPSTVSGARKPRIDANTILNDVVIPDMIRAEQLNSVLSREFRWSLSSIYCLQAEVYMWNKDYVNAKIALNKLIDLGEHSLVTTPLAFFNLFTNDQSNEDKRQFGSELIFSLQANQETNRGGNFALFNNGIIQYVMSPDLENKWREKFPVDSTAWVTKYPNTEPIARRIELVDDGMGGFIEEESVVYGDWRYYTVREGGVELGSREIGDARLFKWGKTAPLAQNADNTDLNVYRYADMLLLLAEAENRDTQEADGAGRALGIINQLRTARLLPPVTALEFGSTVDEREDFILEERRYELVGEGKRWWDLLRTGKAIDVLTPLLNANPNGLPLTNQKLVAPIFDEHLIENNLLMQNPGY